MANFTFKQVITTLIPSNLGAVLLGFISWIISKTSDMQFIDINSILF